MEIELLFIWTRGNLLEKEDSLDKISNLSAYIIFYR